jgi:glycosyltransferase involved in cell wall biosynthesis
VKVQQVLAAAGPVDAVTNQALACRRLFAQWGWEGEDWADHIASGVPRGRMRALDDFEPRNGDVVLLHYSGYSRELDRVVGAGARTLVLSHNITPARYFWAHEPVEGVRCTLAREQLRELALRADAVAGVSRFNAEELRAAGVERVGVIPILFDRETLPAPGPPPAGPPVILFVGRLAPHKRQDLVIRAFAAYRKRHAPDARLVLVGVPMTPEVAASLRALADELAPGAVTIEGGIAPARLWEHYRAATAFLCLSEHEGFCIPLLEAFHFGLPVVARGVGGVPEVVDDAGLLLDEDDDLGVVAEALHLAVSDESLRAELRRRGEQRLGVYALERTAAHLREVVAGLAR